MDATLQDLIDRGAERIHVELASPFVKRVRGSLIVVTSTKRTLNFIGRIIKLTFALH